jgi:hypothetical protein
MRRLALPGLVAGAILVGGASPAPPSTPRLPSIVFVSRRPAPEPGAIPGLGPRHRAIATGGRLLLRAPDGTLHRLLPDGALFDVSDPAVSFDARWIAFAGTPHPDSAFRIYRVRAGGGAPEPVTRTDRPGRYDDLDPCWIGDSVLCFASTRDADESEYGGVPVTNLWVVRAGAAPSRLTFERNGAEEPAFDPTTGHIVYARWWYGRHRAAREAAMGVTTDKALAIPQDSVNLWQSVEIGLDGRGLRLAAGSILSRTGTMAYQPARLADGTWCGVYGRSTALLPSANGAGIQIFPDRYGTSERIAGALPAEDHHDPYAGARGLAVPCAVSPAPLADGRLLAAYDPGGRGDFGIVVMEARGTNLRRVVDLEGTLELDPAPLETLAERERGAARFRRRAARNGTSIDAARPSDGADAIEALGSRESRTFTYDCRNVFAQGAVDAPMPEGPRLTRDLVMRFFVVRARGARPDTAVLIRTAPVAADGSVRVEGLPAETPMFEQLVDPKRGVLLTAHGPAHVAGANWAPAGAVARCAGCHLGHSVLDAGAAGDREALWFNAAPSAVVRAATTRPGTAGAHAAVDRRTRGPLGEIAWIADAAEDTLRLAWNEALEMRAVHLWAPRAEHGSGAPRVSGEMRLLRGGVEVLKCAFGAVGSEGRRLELAALADAIEIRVASTGGRVLGRRTAALAEVEVIARLNGRAP